MCRSSEGCVFILTTERTKEHGHESKSKVEEGKTKLTELLASAELFCHLRDTRREGGGCEADAEAH